jgi:thermitase
VAEVNLTDSPTPSDAYGHGTHIAGIIAASGNNGIGIAGVAPQCRLMNVKVADDKGRCQASAVAEGIIWAVDNGANVINISIELREPSAELEDAVNYAWSQGAVIIAAAGNDGSQSPVYPAYYENCLAVAATKQDGTLAPLSNHGDWVDAAAPGFNIYSTLPQNGYGYKTGTSFATAYVSGLAALLFNVVSDSNGDGRLNDEVRAAIEAEAGYTP